MGAIGTNCLLSQHQRNDGKWPRPHPSQCPPFIYATPRAPLRRILNAWLMFGGYEVAEKIYNRERITQRSKGEGRRTTQASRNCSCASPWITKAYEWSGFPSQLFGKMSRLGTWQYWKSWPWQLGKIIEHEFSFPCILLHDFAFHDSKDIRSHGKFDGKSQMIIRKRRIFKFENYHGTICRTRMIEFAQWK